MNKEYKGCLCTWCRWNIKTNKEYIVKTHHHQDSIIICWKDPHCKRVGTVPNNSPIPNCKVKAYHNMVKNQGDGMKKAYHNRKFSQHSVRPHKCIHCGEKPYEYVECEGKLHKIVISQCADALTLKRSLMCVQDVDSDIVKVLLHISVFTREQKNVNNQNMDQKNHVIICGNITHWGIYTLEKSYICKCD